MLTLALPLTLVAGGLCYAVTRSLGSMLCMYVRNFKADAVVILIPK